MAIDWALTAWGMQGAVSVDILGKDKDEWNFIEREDSLLPGQGSCEDYE